jgi:hypothetical protein
VNPTWTRPSSGSGPSGQPTSDRLDHLRRRYQAAMDEELIDWLVLWTTAGVTDVPSE